VVDSRLGTIGGEYYVKQHLPGAIPLVENDVADRAGAVLPDKASRIVTYCSNPACPNSQRVAGRLTALGYTRTCGRTARASRTGWLRACRPNRACAPVDEPVRRRSADLRFV
jgi:rhodanese-related sulfurtransferase